MFRDQFTRHMHMHTKTPVSFELKTVKPTKGSSAHGLLRREIHGLFERPNSFFECFLLGKIKKKKKTFQSSVETFFVWV